MSTPLAPGPKDWRGTPDARPGHPDVQFEEGIGWDSDVPKEFLIGMSHGEADGARPNNNLNVFHKSREETMKERAHVGSAAWVDSPAHLGSFVDGTQDSDRGEYAHDIRSGLHTGRPAHAVIRD